MISPRRYILPLFAAALLAVVVGSLWNYLLPFATSDGLKLLLYLSMCVLAIASMIGAQALLPRVGHAGGTPHDEHAPAHAGPTPSSPRPQKRAQ